jgi:hypothetical protein
VQPDDEAELLDSEFDEWNEVFVADAEEAA